MRIHRDDNGYKIGFKVAWLSPLAKVWTEDNTDITGDHSDNCVVASRMKYHGVGALVGNSYTLSYAWIELYYAKDIC